VILSLAVALVLALQATPDTGGTIRGQVRSEATGAPLAAASVELRDGTTSRAAISDASGAYVLRNVRAGRHVLRASHVGYEPLELEVMIAPGAEVVVELSLRLRPVTLQGITVRGRLEVPERDSVPAAPPSLGLAGIRAMEAAPGFVELGLGEGSRGAPGQAPIDPSDVLFVRGVASDLKLVLLDGAPVYTPFPVGGLLESFDSRLLRDATLYLGGAPARYDGGLSYILDLSTRAGRADRFSSTGALDLMTARVTTEGGAGGRLRYLVGGRGVHGLGVDPFLRGSNPFAYAEGLARVDASLGDGRGLTLTTFRNREAVSLDSLGNGREAGWGNSAASLRYRGRLGAADSEITAAYGSFAAELPVIGERSFPAHGETSRVRLTADFARDAGPVRLRYGGSYDHLELFHRVVSRPGATELRSWEGSAVGASSGVYVEGAWQPVPRLRVRTGLRGDVFFVDPQPRLAPRVSATWMLSDRAGLTAAAGRYHQYVRQSRLLQELTPADSPDTLFLPAGLGVDRATHFNLALHQELDDGLRLGVEGFFKTFAGEADVFADRTHASGVDLWVRRDSGRLRGWLGYSLSWVWSLPGATLVTDRFAGRQLLNLGLMGPLGQLADFDLRLAYGAGLPFSTIPLGVGHEFSGDAPPQRSQLTGRFSSSEPPLLPEPPADPYLRLDFGLSRTYTREWRGAPLQLTPYLKVLNSLDRRDALFYWADQAGNPSPRAVAALPVLPLLGMEWRF
jgi:hypothetical protein